VSIHPAAWLAWLAAVSAFAFVMTNPLYVLLAIGAVVVVHLSFPPDGSTMRRAVRTFFVMGVVLLGIRLAFVALLTNPGRSVLVTVPRLQAPRWLGGFGLGGPITTEVLVGGATEGLRLILLLTAFGVFNAHTDLSTIVRSVPQAFRDAGLVVSIAVAFVPGIFRAVRDVRDAQRMRGERGRRVAVSLAVPILGIGLERALLLAESMDARGYGRGSSPKVARASVWTGLGGLIAGVGGWTAGFRTPSMVSIALGAFAITWGFRSASRASHVTRLRGRRLAAFDVFLIAAAMVVCGLLVFVGSRTAYDPYPVFAVPGFDVRAAALCFVLAVPAVSGARRT
jgi:energy-coupling factor transport system permease protein